MAPALPLQPAPKRPACPEGIEGPSFLPPAKGKNNPSTGSGWSVLGGWTVPVRWRGWA